MNEPRHAAPDRWIHWSIAASMGLLLATSLPPRLDNPFEWGGIGWLPIHWATGLLLTLLLALHLLRVRQRGTREAMRLRVAELGAYLTAIAGELSGRPARLAERGKYSLPQKLFHHAVALLLLTGVATGLLLLARIDTPLWERDPYWLPDAAWGTIYVLHDLVALLFIPAIMLHLYFAARPEKRHFTRAMAFGTAATGDEEEKSR